MSMYIHTPSKRVQWVCTLVWPSTDISVNEGETKSKWEQWVCTLVWPSTDISYCTRLIHHIVLNSLNHYHIVLKSLNRYHIVLNSLNCWLTPPPHDRAGAPHTPTQHRPPPVLERAWLAPPPTCETFSTVSSAGIFYTKDLSYRSTDLSYRLYELTVYVFIYIHTHTAELTVYVFIYVYIAPYRATTHSWKFLKSQLYSEFMWCALPSFAG